MAKQTKKQKALAEAGTVDRNRLYGVDEAISIIKANATAKFDETVEIALNLGVDPRHADQMVRVKSRKSRTPTRARERGGKMAKEPEQRNIAKSPIRQLKARKRGCRTARNAERSESCVEEPLSAGRDAAAGPPTASTSRDLLQ